MMSDNLKKVDLSCISWKVIKNDGLDLEYTVPIPRSVADGILMELEETLCFFTGDLAKIKVPACISVTTQDIQAAKLERVFGKIYPLPRQQVAYGDPGITYTYSGITVPALPWPKPVLMLRDFLFTLKGIKYEFVLVNKYRNGNDHMGEHRDNEPDLDPKYPIASISFGEERPFVLKHKDARKPGPLKKNISPVIIKLEHGSVLLMNPPTNDIWYHSLPTRKRIKGARINFTFRKMVQKNIF